MTTFRILDFHDFVIWVSEVTGVDVRADSNATLVEVGLDSLAAYEMLIAFDEMFSEQVPIDLWDSLVTVGDVYAYYQTVAVRQ